MTHSQLADDRGVQIAFLRKRFGAERMSRSMHRYARMSGDAPRPVRPVFVIGCPRSGTSLLFHLLGQHADLRHLGTEGFVFWAHRHPARNGWVSDAADASDADESEQTYVYSSIQRVAGGGRLLEKTPKNCLRVRYLDALFPDASYVFLTRDPRATVASLIDGWHARHGVSYRLPERLRLAEYRGRYWSYVLPKGWRDLKQTSIPVVAAHQYVASYEHASEDLARIPSNRVVRASYEDLVSRPVAVATDLVDALALPANDDVVAAAKNLGSHRVSSVTPPRRDKWRARAAEIAQVWPSLVGTSERLGYGSDPG
jgi:hypothetical protein